MAEESNILSMLATRSTFQLAMFWSKSVALLKREYMVATLATFQPPMFWLKTVALRNMAAPRQMHTKTDGSGGKWVTRVRRGWVGGWGGGQVLGKTN